MFQFRRFPSYTYFVQYRIPCGGFPHSDISGSMLICSSPKLFAAYHVLHRLLMPRHSPCALSSLTSSKLMEQISANHPEVSPRMLCSPCSIASPLKFKPASLGFEFVWFRWSSGSLLPCFSQSTILEKSIWFSN